MAELCEQVSGGLYDRACMTEQRLSAYQHSLATNPSFVFGPLQVIMYGAATFMYRVYGDNDGVRRPEFVNVFMGAQKQSDGSYIGVPEKIPDGWTNIEDSYSFTDALVELAGLYLAHTVLFGTNAGANNFLGINMTNIVNGAFNGQDVNDFACLLRGVLLSNAPYTVPDILNLTLTQLTWLTGKLSPIFFQFGC